MIDDDNYNVDVDYCDDCSGGGDDDIGRASGDNGLANIEMVMTTIGMMMVIRRRLGDGDSLAVLVKPCMKT